MTNPSEIERRLAAQDVRIDAAAADAAAARHLAAAMDRDWSDLGIKVDANRAAINALGVQTAEQFARVNRGFEQIDRRFDRLENEMRTGFAEVGIGFAAVRGRLDQAAAGQQQIVELLTTLIDRGEDE